MSTEDNKTLKEVVPKASQPQEIAPGVYCMEVGTGIMRSNVYFVRSGSSWVLIDTASAKCSRVFLEAAESLFGADTRPAAILLTHSHPDHAGSTPIPSHGAPIDVSVHSVAPEGVDVAFDVVGGHGTAECIRATKRGGMIVTYGFMGTMKNGKQSRASSSAGSGPRGSGRASLGGAVPLTALRRSIGKIRDRSVKICSSCSTCLQAGRSTRRLRRGFRYSRPGAGMRCWRRVTWRERLSCWRLSSCDYTCVRIGKASMNMGKPVLTFLVENFDELHSSVERLKKLKIHAVYPGNGLPFPVELFIKNH